MAEAIVEGRAHPMRPGWPAGRFSPVERAALAGGMVAASLVPLNSTMIAVGLPDVADDFGMARASAAWLITAYLVVMALCQPGAGRLGDRFGSRRVALVALNGFAAASVLAAVAPSFPALIGGRVLQALFASALVPNLQAIIRVIVADERRGRAFGIFGMGIGAGAALGPVVGGVLVDILGWRALFAVNGPVGLAGLLLVARVAVTAGAPRDAADPVGRPLRSRAFVAACITQGSSNLAMYSVLLVVPLVLDARGWSGSATGLVLLGLTAGMVVLSPVGGMVGDARGRARPVVAGMVLVAAGCLLLAAVAGDSPPALVVGVVLVGTGMGLASASLQAAGLEAVPPHVSGSAAGILSTSRYFGSIIGSLAIAGVMGADAAGARTVLSLAVVAAVGAVAAGVRITSGDGQPAISQGRPGAGARGAR